MESTPNQESNVENIDVYRERREAGHHRAQEKIHNIEGFNEMDYREQFAMLSELLKGAEDGYEEDFIAAYMTNIELEEEKDKIDGHLEKLRQHYSIAS